MTVLLERLFSAFMLTLLLFACPFIIMFQLYINGNAMKCRRQNTTLVYGLSEEKSKFRFLIGFVNMFCSWFHMTLGVS